MEETAYFIGAFILGIASGVVLAMQYYGTQIYAMHKHNIDLLRKLQAEEKKPATMKEIEMFQRGGRFALQTMCDFTKQRLEVRVKDLPDMTIYPPEDE